MKHEHFIFMQFQYLTDLRYILSHDIQLSVLPVSATHFYFPAIYLFFEQDKI